MESETTMFGSHRIKFDPQLLERARLCAARVGYSSVEEFITHILEKELQHFEDAESDEDIKNKLRGLGYIS